MKKSLAVFDSLFAKLRLFYLPLSIVVLSLLVQLTNLKDTLDFDRTNINQGHWWLLFTGHFSHLNWLHWFLNNMALLIIWELFYRYYPFVRACLEFFFLALCVGLGIYLFNPEVEWYVGLSGILHGMFAIGIFREVLKKNRLSLLVAGGLTAKIIWEQNVGLTTGTFFSADEVLVDAHLYGAIGGAAWVFIARLFTRITFQQSPSA